ALMLEHIGEMEAAEKIRAAVNKVIGEGKTVTPDLGGSATTEQYVNAIIKAL
ncbi:MAG: hypothetical protein D6748_03860, partial [Calditrichaeota bacterium]